MDLTIALAIFVKTPGISPIKTRLAKGIGTAKAESVYLHLIDYIKEFLKTLPSSEGVQIVPYWAIAEAEGQDYHLWDGHHKLVQTEGDLGLRIQSIVDQLRQRHDGFILIGADCPYIKGQHLERAIEGIRNNRVVLGPARDGGFWLLGKGNREPCIDFREFAYSQDDTLAQIENYILNKNHSTPAGSEILRLETLEDIDHIECLERLAENLSRLSVERDLSESEAKLNQFIASIL